MMEKKFGDCGGVRPVAHIESGVTLKEGFTDTHTDTDTVFLWVFLPIFKWVFLQIDLMLNLVENGYERCTRSPGVLIVNRTTTRGINVDGR